MALAAALRESRGLWFGWSGNTTPEFHGEPMLEETGGATVATIDLEEQDVEEYYNGYANETLWPLFHYRIDLTEYQRSSSTGYARVNARFADALQPLLRDDDIIWVHDYHLIPLGRELRRRGVANRIGFFLHIPWPPCELMSTLPRHKSLVESLFDYDVVGFQTEAWLKAFQGYAVDEAGGEILPDGTISAFGQTIVARAFPIGIDADDVAAMARSPVGQESYERMKLSAGGRAMILGVDRIDYSKGLEDRFLAYEQFLTDYPEFRERVFMLQIGQPSRGEVDTYQDIRSRLESLAGRINSAFAAVDWVPLRYVSRSYGRDELTGIYRAARIALVTPLRDGMNLVAKEYVAAQDPDDPGVLILSRFAGAALQMTDSLLVNPYSHEDVSDAISRALAMPREERIERWKALYEDVSRSNVVLWRDSFVRDLRAAKPDLASASLLRFASSPSHEKPRNGMVPRSVDPSDRNPGMVLR